MSRKNKTNSFAILLVVATLCFIYFNYSTTKEMLVAIWGSDPWIIAFAMAIAAVDFAGLARMNSDHKSENESDYEDDEFDLRKLLTFVWLFSVGGDLFLTWLWASWKMEAHTTTTLTTDMYQSAKIIAPIMIAISEAAIRIPLIIMLSREGHKLFYRGEQHRKKVQKEKKPARVPQQVPSYTRPPATSRIRQNHRPKPAQAQGEYRSQDYMG